MIQKRDQYYIPIKIKKNGVIVDDTVDDIIIKIGEIAKHKEDLHFQNGRWFFWLTQDETEGLEYYTSVQAQIREGDNVFNTPIKQICILESIITEDDEEEENA